MVVRNDKLRWIGGLLALANLAMFLIWGWGTLFFWASFLAVYCLLPDGGLTKLT